MMTAYRGHRLASRSHQGYSPLLDETSAQHPRSESSLGRRERFGTQLAESLPMTTRDTRIGLATAIAPGRMTESFEPFATNTPHGTGLGLAIALKIVARRDARRHER